MKNYLYIFFLIPFFANSQSEIDKTIFNEQLHKKIYNVEYGDCQVLELIKMNDNTITGSFTNCVWKLAKNEVRGKIVMQKINLSVEEAQNLFNDLEKNKFDRITDCNDMGLDGTTTTFISNSKELKNTASYWELESDYYKRKETDNCKYTDAKILTSIISKYINVENSFKTFTGKLPKGKYTFGMIILEKK